MNTIKVDVFKRIHIKGLGSCILKALMKKISISSYKNEIDPANTIGKGYYTFQKKIHLVLYLASNVNGAL